MTTSVELPFEAVEKWARLRGCSLLKRIEEVGGSESKLTNHERYELKGARALFPVESQWGMDGEKTTEVTLHDVHVWVLRYGSGLVQLINESGGIGNLTDEQQRRFKFVQAVCPCHYTDHPAEEFGRSDGLGHCCEICGRPM